MMTIGSSELIAIMGMLFAFIAWVNSNFGNIDKRFDRTKDDNNIRFDNLDKDLNGLGSRIEVIDKGTTEILYEQINQLKTKQFDLESQLTILRGK
jgi:hypothetical protein